MGFINKQDTDGTKATLLKGELGYDDYTAGGDAGRVYVGNGSSNIALAKINEDTTGNAATADSSAKLTTGRTIALTGDVTATGVTFDGTTNILISTVVTNDSHTHATQYLGLTAKAADSDKLDNLDSTQFLRSDIADIMTAGSLTFNDNIELYFGTGNDASFWCNGVHMYTDLGAGIGNWYIRDGTTTRFTFDDAGDFTATGNVTAYSDKRLKTNIEVIDDALSKVCNLSGYTFDRTDIDAKQTGVIAQEVQAVLPEAVVEDEEGMLSVNYGSMVGLLIESIKELKAEIEELKAK